MTNLIHGIHHITAIASDPKATLDFYTRILGLRLVKKSVNQDDVATYHLFFGDRTGEPGMDLTFFTFQPVMAGKRGVGQVTMISLAVPAEALSFWLKRLNAFKVKNEGISESFGYQKIIFYDHDDQRLELVRVEAESAANVWATGEIPEAEAIRHFHSARLSVTDKALVEHVLTTVFGYEAMREEQNVTLYDLPDSGRAAFLEIEELNPPEKGLNAAGTVHHIAFEVSNEEIQREVREKLLQLGYYPTEVINRYYFKSVYFRTPGGILFELATSGPGFTADEAEAELGQKLALPPFLESRRQEIEAGLIPLE